MLGNHSTTELHPSHSKIIIVEIYISIFSLLIFRDSLHIMFKPVSVIYNTNAFS
jgi:hypothetical protein